MHLLSLSALALGVSTASAYLDTSPFFMFSTSELLNGATKISTAEAVTSEISQSLSRCPSDYYILMSQPGVTTDDYRSRRTSSSLSQYVAGKTGSDGSDSNNIRSSLSIPEVIGTVDVSALARQVAQACEIAQVDIDATAGSIPAVLPSGRSVVTVQLAVPLAATREHDLSQNDGLFASLLDLIPASASYTVVYTTSVDGTDKNGHENGQGKASDATQQSSSLHLDLKRGTQRQTTRRSSSDKDNNTLVDGPLFHRYQFFTPGIFMGFLVGLILLLILYVGISALASLQVTYAAFDKEQGQLAPKKVQ